MGHTARPGSMVPPEGTRRRRTGQKSRKTNELLLKADTYQWTWHGYNDDMKHEGTVLEANGKDKFAFSFSSNCPVTVSIYKEQEEVIVELIEDNIPVDNARIFKHYTSNTMGWTFYLTNLKSVLEGGLDSAEFQPFTQERDHCLRFYGIRLAFGLYVV